MEWYIAACSYSCWRLNFFIVNNLHTVHAERIFFTWKYIYLDPKFRMESMCSYLCIAELLFLFIYIF